MRCGEMRMSRLRVQFLLFFFHAFPQPISCTWSIIQNGTVSSVITVLLKIVNIDSVVYFVLCLAV